MNIQDWTSDEAFIPKSKETKGIFQKAYAELKTNEKLGNELFSIPTVNKNDDPDEIYRLTIPVRGFEKSDIKVAIMDNYLLVSANRQFERILSFENDNWPEKTPGYHNFQRGIKMPADADFENLKVQLVDFKLQFTIPKLAQSKNERNFYAFKIE